MGLKRANGTTPWEGTAEVLALSALPAVLAAFYEHAAARNVVIERISAAPSALGCIIRATGHRTP